MTSSNNDSDKSRYDWFHGKTENELKEEARWHLEKQIRETQEQQKREQEQSEKDDYDIDERNS